MVHQLGFTRRRPPLPIHHSIGVVLVAAALGCHDSRLGHALPAGVRVDTYLQTAASKVDVLWIIDDSASMAPRQENLARNFQAFITEFTRNAVDYRIAITTTDVFREAGHFVGSPSILTPATPAVLDAFAASVRVGVSGSPYEVGLDAARLALDGQKQANDAQLASCKAACGDSACRAGCEQVEPPFLRPDAYLFLVFVSDEDDQSSPDVTFFYRYFETVKGLGNDGMVSTAAIMGDVPSNGCGATPGVKYQALSELTGGAVGSICDESFSSTLKKLASNAVGLKRKFALEAAPSVDSLEVRVVYPCSAPDELLAPCESVDRSSCAGQPAQTMSVVCTPPQGGPDGWSYDAASNVVAFSGVSVPALTGRIELQYGEAGKSP